jgi:hypothetical protein
VNDEVRVRKEIDVTLVLLVPRWLTLGSCRRVRGMRLVIHRVHNRIAAGLQAIAQRESRVIEILRGDAHFTNRKFSLGDIVKANRRCQLRQRDGKVIVSMAGFGTSQPWQLPRRTAGHGSKADTQPLA